MKNLLIIGLCLSLFGCATTPKYVEKPFVEPEYGMTKLEMLDLLGKPDSVEVYRKADQSRIEFYFFTRKYQTSEEQVPVCLIDGRIVGWGKTFYDDHRSIDDVRIK